MSLKIGAGKLHADDTGREQALPVNDLIDIGVFARSGLGQRPLSSEEHRLTEGETTFEVEVREPPTTVGIDPSNKLVDRRSDDTTIMVTKSQAAREKSGLSLGGISSCALPIAP